MANKNNETMGVEENERIGGEATSQNREKELDQQKGGHKDEQAASLNNNNDEQAASLNNKQEFNQEKGRKDEQATSDNSDQGLYQENEKKGKEVHSGN
ncbi:hypothetical protein [Neobacillus soli]|uniref:hypothetical protein n=1 Tax=Neobacillus soli TaxID=220688 RepID=UPI000824B49C|nr:hypothetical protein [Neobacillus soli]